MNKETDWPLAGNENIKEFLSKHIAKGTAQGAYVFSGPAGLGKKTLAYFFAKSLLCKKKNKNESRPCGKCPSCKSFEREGGSSHSDFYQISKDDDKKNISIEQVRELIKKLSMSAFLDSYKIGIINDAHALSQEAGNALLKTLEEPNKSVIVVLVTSNIDLLPETIVSRSRVLKFNPVKADDIYKYLVEEKKVSRGYAKNFSRLAGGRPAMAVKFSEDKEYHAEYLRQAKVFLDFFQGDINDRFLAIEDLVGKKARGQADAGAIREILDVWRGLARDFILLDANQGDLIRNEPMKDDIEKAKKDIDPGDAISMIRSIDKGEKYLNANVNPKACLELIAVSI